MKLAVIGAGAAGAAAAWSAARAGASVTVFRGPAGATELYSGALDGGEQESDAGVVAFAAALSAWSLGALPRRVATEAGWIRACRGIDTALLDLDAIAGRTVAVADVPALGWDAKSLARVLWAQPWSRSTGTRFEAVEVPGLVTDAESRFSHYDLAARLDEPGRGDRFAASLGAHRADAWLLGPWLGTRPGAADRLRERLGVPCGEVAAGYDAVAGARFAAARDDLFRASSVEVIASKVARIRPNGQSAEVVVAQGDPRSFDAVVLAVGGVVAGGIELEDPYRDGPPGFRLSVDAPVQIGLDGAVRDGFSSVYGMDLQSLGLGAVERVGVLVDESYAAARPTVFAAGDVVAGRPRAVLEAARAGIAAAAAAVRDRVG